MDYNYDIETAKSNDDYYFYFAYGSNMNLEQMSVRCPTGIKIGKGVLHNYQVVEAKYADIDETMMENVNGLVWKVNKNELKNLDAYESYPEQYFRFIQKIDVNGKLIQCIIYKMTKEYRDKKKNIHYSEEYKCACRKGAEDNGIPSVF
ncbi:hypothetical protein TVAG_478790 [Trichomonas vaginalis G3]|uniref:gamma-glutamylcyclotransferase n=1 Tax=Trichomonas vaginalis (strain ATCC PRA-98 / G3) TaxID=412133 RepID=A2DZZ5_TRIV3|nr:gamma-glutamyl cyclotransferase family [Trichomonas vaginalis G3]EAY14054.1 hypothetical protein TVAG_478790 [Trichomonas vaginalis G3]KAI5519504.1 gamma-glutamyl cyclotransferase family [Trichomonas vaginalis G3]|eukprot:XP_001326277.1 hypothetical protein [Trichomonas vaginalis G3]